MSRQIKLIWDFRGPFQKTAEHEIHLKEYIVGKNITGFEIKVKCKLLHLW
jgi:hypothetical protein